ncbi:MAG: hypothetical protein IT378_20075 [Sandaracinaceae bacterium]|nr:hypothetical protein [Sandaracinaceae bacterium]
MRRDELGEQMDIGARELDNAIDLAALGLQHIEGLSLLPLELDQRLDVGAEGGRTLALEQLQQASLGRRHG